MKNKYIYGLILILGITLFLILQFFWIYNTPLSGDGSYHTEFFRQNYIQGTITYLHNYLYGHYGFPRVQQFTLNYPPLYHTLGGILYGYFGNKTVYVLDMIFSFVIILSFYFLFENKKIFLLILPILVLNSGFYVSGGNNNLILALSILLVSISIYKYIKTKKNKFITLFVIFSIFGFGTKQLFYFVYPLLYIFVFFYAFRNKNLKEIIIGTLIILVGIYPMIYWQIKNTGTLSTQTIQGWPIIDKYIFKPRHFQIEDWQKEIDNIVNIKKLDKISAQHYHKVNKGLDDVWNYSFFENLLFNTYSTLPGSLKIKNNFNPLLLLFTILGVIFLFRKNKKLFLLTIILIIGGLIPYKFTSRIEYSLIISLVLLLYWLYYISNYKGKNIKVLILSIIFIISFINLFSYINTQKIFWENTYSRIKLNNNNSFRELLNYLNDNSNIDKTKLILHNNSQEFPFQSKLKTFWDFRLNFLNKDEFQKFLPYYKRKGWKYTLIFKKSVRKKFDNWGIILESSYFYRKLKNEDGFKKLYENNDFILYEFVENDNNIKSK